MMGCSQGSVKTHCSRAVHTMATILQKQGLGKREISALVQIGVET
jgi:RNA polymerase sigma-70 factor, ECF subfamily